MSKLPIVAKAYHLRVSSTLYGDRNRRSLLEGSFIAHVLDHLAAKRTGQAADLLAQRYTAIEATYKGMSWDKAKFLELVGEEDLTLVGQHEMALVAHESAQASRVADLTPAAAVPWQRQKGGKNDPWGKGGWRPSLYPDVRDQRHGGDGPDEQPALALPDRGWNPRNKGQGKDKGQKGFGKGKGKGQKW